MTFRRPGSNRQNVEIQNRLRTDTSVSDVTYEVVQVTRNGTDIRPGVPGYRTNDGLGRVVNGGQYAVITNPPNNIDDDVATYYVQNQDLIVEGNNGNWEELTFLVF